MDEQRHWPPLALALLSSHRFAPAKLSGSSARRKRHGARVPRGFWIRSFVSPPRTMQELGPVPDPDPISRQSQVAK